MDTLNGFIVFVLVCIAMVYCDQSKYIGSGPGLVMIKSSIQFFVGLTAILKPILFPTLPIFYRGRKADAA